jgi:glycerol-3-phosphate acyltransferase PlsY
MGIVMVLLLAIPLAYLLGTLPSAQLAARASGHDPLREGSKNPGATNVVRIAGWRAGVVVFLADIAKGAVAAGAGLIVAGRPGGFACGLAAVVGHVFPVTRGFRGGKGVATAGGMLVVLFPIYSVGFAVLFFVVARLTRTMSIASLVIAIGFPIAIAIGGAPGWEVASLAVLGALLVARHWSNLRRIVQGREHRLGGGSVDAEEDA